MPETANLAPVRSGAVAATNIPPGFVQLPTDRQRSTTTGYQRASIGARWLKAIIGEQMAALAGALCAVLYRYTQQEAIVLEFHAYQPNPHRHTSALLHCPIKADDSLGDAVARAASAIDALRDQTPSKPPGHAGSNIAVSWVDLGDAPEDVLDDSDTYDLHLVAQANSPVLRFAYNARLFEAATIERLADAVLRVCKIAVDRPETPIGELPVLSTIDLHRITVDWDRGHADYLQEPVHRVFERLARERPRSLAVSFDNHSLTYEQLDAQSNRLAHHLLALGVKPASAVCVCVHPSLDIVVAFLAIWKAGAVYVPLDPAYPKALIARILDDLQPAMVLTTSALGALTNRQRYAQFCFDTDSHRTQVLPASAPAVQVTLDDPAYILYTSGTTGMPKGVDARHINLAHYIYVAQQKYGFGPDDKFCSLARYAFSISLFELISPLCCGASLRLLSRDDVLAPNRLARWLSDVTVIHAGPSLLGSLFAYLQTKPFGSQTFPRLRHASSGGDLVPTTLIERMKEVFENAELFVIYGCTEISCMGCTYPISRNGKMTRTFVGKPFADVVVRVTDQVGNSVPFGAIGEICFAGKGVVRGYLHHPDLTAEKFVARESMRFYRTGDMGRLHADGNIEFLGRRDDQIQLRGIRVELTAIENTVREIELAEQCAVVMKKLNDHDARLVAFVVKPREITITGFRRALAAHLPDYMLPQALVALPVLPANRNGKLDRSALQELPWENAQTDSTRTMPRTPLERQIAEAFAKALGVDEVGIDDDFFHSGGHSLLAVALLLDLEDLLGVTLPHHAIFERPTIRAMAELAQAPMAQVIRPIPLNAASDKPAVFMLFGVQTYRPLAKRLESDYSVFAVYSERELVSLEPTDEPFTVQALAGDYIRTIQRQQPNGPYRLVGYSFGGIVAFEVAQQLRAAGEEVAFIGLIDAVLPEFGRGYRFRQLGRIFYLSPAELLRAVKFRLRLRLPGLFGERPKSEYMRYDTPERLVEIDWRRQAAYDNAARSYVAQLRPWAGNIDMPVAGGRLANDPLLTPDSGWATHPVSVTPHVIDADHFRIVEEPSVATLAAIFLRGLRASEKQTPADSAGHVTHAGACPASFEPNRPFCRRRDL